MAITGVDHTAIVVSDLARSLAFYCDIVGLELGWQVDDDGHELARMVGYEQAMLRMAELRLPGGHRLELIEYVRPRGRTQAPERCDVGAAHICLRVDDVTAEVNRLKEAGVDTFVSDPVEFTDGPDAGSRVVYVCDPDGIILELYEPH